MKKKEREDVPKDIAATVIFLSDRTCCVCQKKGKQIHHLDENPSNNDFDNLAFLCFDCHEETQIKGGFSRKLDAATIRLFRNEWYDMVAKKKSIQRPLPQRTKSVSRAKKGDRADKAFGFTPRVHEPPPFDLEQFKSLLEEYKNLTDDGMRQNILGEIKELGASIYAQEGKPKEHVLTTLLPTLLELYDLDTKSKGEWLGFIRSFYVFGPEKIRQTIKSVLFDKLEAEIPRNSTKNWAYIELIQLFHNYDPDFMVKLIDAGVDTWDDEGFRQLDNRISFYQSELHNPGALKKIRKHILDISNALGSDREKLRRVDVLYRRLVTDTDIIQKRK